ncbi:MAG: hypothetical protein HYW07_24735 [Candidatus Latescibacteria bacterium]|nr:hypothetical protein [Candidatus Latescibacterota bacterium]
MQRALSQKVLGKRSHQMSSAPAKRPVPDSTTCWSPPLASAPWAFTSLMDSLGRLIDWPVAYASAAPLFCFGLLREFDLPDLIDLSAPVPLYDTEYRGPLRAVRPK